MTDELNPTSTENAEVYECPVSDADIAKDILSPLFAYFMDQLCAESHKGRDFTEKGLSDLEKLITDLLADPASLERLRSLEAWVEGLDVDADGKIDILEGFREEFNSLVERVSANESKIASNKALQDAIAKEFAEFRVTAAETIAGLTRDISDLKIKSNELEQQITEVGTKADSNTDAINSVKGTAEGNVVKIDELRRDLDQVNKYDPDQVRILFEQVKCETRMGIYSALKGSLDSLIAGHQACTAYPEVTIPINEEELPPENDEAPPEPEDDLPPGGEDAQR